MPVTPLDAFAQILSEETGYATQTENRSRMERLLQARAKATAGGDVPRYLALLRVKSPAARAEWQEVVRELTMSESFFFRDAAQFRLLRETLLPQLIARRSDRRTLRIWSAGCSTGEEPYSICILLGELLPAPAGWDVSIVGTDINEASLEQAREGLYTRWSLRGMTLEERERYFEQQGDRFRLRPEYRRNVTFQRSNLVTDRIPSFTNGLHDMDLILCRNVFIYFAPETTGRVAEKLAHALAPGGFLLTGHAEIQGHTLAALRTRVLPGSLVHERPVFDLRATAPRTADATGATAPASAGRTRGTGGENRDGRPQDTGHMQSAEEAFRHAEYEEAIRGAEAQLHAHPDHEPALRLAAAAAANLGQHVRAAGYCRRLLDARPHDIEARYLLAKLAQDRGNENEARDLLTGLLADAPSFVPGYLDLAWLEKRRGDTAGADELRGRALELLENLPSGTILSAYDGITVEDLLSQLRREPPQDADKEGS